MGLRETMRELRVSKAQKNSSLKPRPEPEVLNRKPVTQTNRTAILSHRLKKRSDLRETTQQPT